MANEQYLGRAEGDRHRPEVAGLAIAAFVYSLLSIGMPVVFTVIALVTANRAERRIRGSDGRLGGLQLVDASRRIAKTWLILVLVITVVFVGLFVILASTYDNDPEQTRRGETQEAASQEHEGQADAPPTTEVPLVDPATVDYANFTHTLDCLGEPENFTLVDGEAQQGDIASGDPYIQLHEVFFMDVDGDGDIEALADITCSVGAGTVIEQVLTYQAAPERPVRLGSTIFGFSPIVADGSIMTHEPVYGPDDPRCCPSGYQRDTYEWSMSARDFIITDSQPVSESELPPSSP